MLVLQQCQQPVLWGEAVQASPVPRASRELGLSMQEQQMLGLSSDSYPGQKRS